MGENIEKSGKKFDFEKLTENGMAGVGVSTPKEVAQIPVLVLAYVGDAVYEVFVRSWIACTQKVPVKMLHKASVGFVSATAQYNSLMKIAEFLTVDEQEIVRRGRNSKTNSSPKNVNITEYRHATAFEVLIGYLYLSGQIKRLNELIEISFGTEKGNDKEKVKENGEK